VQQLVKDLEEKLGGLIAEFDKAMAEKNAVQEEAERCQTKLEMAQRLVGALGANGVIWESSIDKTAEDLTFIPGDTLVACSFASYVGVYTLEYRDKAIEVFVDFLLEKEVPLSPQPDPVRVLSNEAEQAKWCSMSLPSDRVSLENGAIMTSSERWCLMIDPQMQGILWVKNKEADNNLQTTVWVMSRWCRHLSNRSNMEGACSLRIWASL
jgi:dynein heavy chain